MFFLCAVGDLCVRSSSEICPICLICGSILFIPNQTPGDNEATQEQHRQADDDTGVGVVIAARAEIETMRAGPPWVGSAVAALTVMAKRLPLLTAVEKVLKAVSVASHSPGPIVTPCSPRGVAGPSRQVSGGRFTSGAYTNSNGASPVN